MQLQPVQQLDLFQRISIGRFFPCFRWGESLIARLPFQREDWFSLPNQSHGIDHRELSQCSFYVGILTLHHDRLHPFAGQYGLHTCLCQLVE